MTSEWRTETCTCCGADRDRVWLTRLLPKGATAPAGWRRTRTRGSWTTIEARTFDTTLCLCDAV
jgi:hypothetical protein